MRRHLLGFIAVVLVLGGVAGWLQGGSASEIGFVPSACIRMGCVLGALWLAFPQIIQVSKHFPQWLVAVVVLSFVGAALFSRRMVALVPLLVALTILLFLGTLLRPPPRSK